MATTFQTRDSKLAYRCRKAQRDGAEITVTIDVRGRPKEITGRVLDVGLHPTPSQDTVWEITIAEKP
jgi:hypothetical protein